MYKQSDIATDVDKDREGNKQDNLLESIWLGRCHCGEGVRVAFLSGAVTIMLKHKEGNRASLRECWGKYVLEGILSTEALRSGGGWRA